MAHISSREKLKSFNGLKGPMGSGSYTLVLTFYSPVITVGPRLVDVIETHTYFELASRSPGY